MIGEERILNEFTIIFYPHQKSLTYYIIMNQKIKFLEWFSFLISNTHIETTPI